MYLGYIYIWKKQNKKVDAPQKTSMHRFWCVFSLSCTVGGAPDDIQCIGSGALVNFQCTIDYVRCQECGALTKLYTPGHIVRSVHQAPNIIT